jgi:thiamine pyrophosphate-dependent acetolactate synthase large subunit-like protein/nitrite reductase/ring-hydroxylating ferredoxin subunit
LTQKKPDILQWFHVLNVSDLPEGRVKNVYAGKKSLAITHYEGKFTALDNSCPHQGGPLGEGQIENGWLRCPWHGYDYHPCTGKPPQGFDDDVDTFPVDIRENGIYVGLLKEKEEVKTVSDLMVETLINWGVTSIFGMVGHSNLGLADAFRKQEKSGKLNYIGVRHEGAASFAASAYAKLTGKPAACFSIAGPGATNMLTGLWDAKVDRVPVLALTGQIETQVLGPGAFQEVDLNSAFEAVSSWKQTVLPSSKHAELMTLAIKNALIKRDVSSLIFPNEVQTIPAADSPEPSSPEGRLTDFEISPSKKSIDQSVKLISNAKRPVIIVGHGAKFHMKSIIKFAKKLNSPVITTFKGKGLISDKHPLACGVLGRSGTPIASWFMNESDLLIVIGASFSNHTGIAPYKPIIQIDFDPMALGKFHSVTVPLWGEIGTTVNLLNQKSAANSNDSIKDEIAQRWKLWRIEKSSREKDDSGKGINSASIFAAMNRVIPDNAVIAVDVGNNTYSFGRYFECENQSVLMSGYLGSIGFGYPAAIGAWAANTNRPVFAVTGDGGFGQYMAELTTAVKYKMNITHILLNNNELGKISKEQRADELEVWKTSLHNPNFSKYAKNCGALGIQVTKKSDLENALKEALNYNGPSMVEIMTDPLLI